MMNPGNWKALPSHPDEVEALMDAVNRVGAVLAGEAMPALVLDLPLPYNGTGIWAVQVAPKLFVVVKPRGTRTEYARNLLGAPDYTRTVEIAQTIYALFERQPRMSLVWGPVTKSEFASLQDLADVAIRRGARRQGWQAPDESGNIAVQMTRKQALDLRILGCRCGHDPRDHYAAGQRCAHCACTSLEVVTRQDMKVIGWPTT